MIPLENEIQPSYPSGEIDRIIQKANADLSPFLREKNNDNFFDNRETTIQEDTIKFLAGKIINVLEIPILRHDLHERISNSQKKDYTVEGYKYNFLQELILYESYLEFNPVIIRAAVKELEDADWQDKKVLLALVEKYAQLK
jgi:hypothetical protein